MRCSYLFRSFDLFPVCNNQQLHIVDLIRYSALIQVLRLLAYSCLWLAWEGECCGKQASWCVWAVRRGWSRTLIRRRSRLRRPLQTLAGRHTLRLPTLLLPTTTKVTRTRDSSSIPTVTPSRSSMVITTSSSIISPCFPALLKSLQLSACRALHTGTGTGTVKCIALVMSRLYDDGNQVAAMSLKNLHRRQYFLFWYNPKDSQLLVAKRLLSNTCFFLPTTFAVHTVTGKSLALWTFLAYNRAKNLRHLKTNGGCSFLDRQLASAKFSLSCAQKEPL